MEPNIFQSIEILSKEKGIDSQIVFDAVRDAMLIAAKKHFRTAEDMIAEMDTASGSIKLYAVKTAVEAVDDPVHQMTLSEARRWNPAAEIGSEIRMAKSTEALGRIAAQTAKQVIFQKVREAERETVFNEYSERAGELVNCVVKRVEGPDLVLDLGKTEARLPRKEQSRLENFSVGDRVRCVIKIVDKTSKGPGVVVSRADGELVKRLFEQEVPEIYDGTVSIKACAREAGERTKIAVLSRDRDVDCVGACVGMKGMRVQSIIRELRGEKIDIIEYSEDAVQFATHALSPAKISRVTILNPLEHHMEVIVDDSQLSLAIGKKGQNVRLAAKLLNWKIDIKSEEEKRQEVESQMAALVTPGAPISVLLEHGLGEPVVDLLVGADIGTVEKLGNMTPEELEQIEGITPQVVQRIQVAINGYYGQYDEPAEGYAEAADEASGETVQGETVQVVTGESLAAEGSEDSAEVANGEVPSEAASVPSETDAVSTGAAVQETRGANHSGHVPQLEQHSEDSDSMEDRGSAAKTAEGEPLKGD